MSSSVINNLKKEIQQYDTILPSVISSNKLAKIYENEEETNYNVGLKMVKDINTDISKIASKANDAIKTIRDDLNLYNDALKSGTLTSKEVQNRRKQFIKNYPSTQNNVPEKEKLFSLIQKENVILQQYHNDLLEKLNTYDRKTEFTTPYLDFLQWLNFYLFYLYFLCFLIFSYILFARLSWNIQVKFLVFGLFVLYPFYIYSVEYIVWDNIVYMYCVVFAVPYKSPEKLSV